MGLTGWRLVSLVAAALIGGYALATAVGIFLGGVLSLPRGEGPLIGNLASFAIYAIAIIWVFTVRRPLRAWVTLLVPSMALAAAGLLLWGQTP